MTPVSEEDKARIAEVLARRQPMVDEESSIPVISFDESRPKPNYNGNGTARKTKTYKIGQWSPLADVKPRELKWLWPNKIPIGMLVIFAGDAGLGKSLMALEL